MYPTYDPTAISVKTPGPHTPPRSNVGWAVAAVVFFWPVAFSAFAHAFDVYPLWASGGYAGADLAAARTKKLGVIALMVWFVMMVAVVGAYIVFIAWILANRSII